MANNNGRIDFNVDFNVNRSKLSELRSELQQLANINFDTFFNQNSSLGIQEARRQFRALKEDVNEVQKVLTRTFNANLGSLNLSRLEQELRKLDLQRIYRDFQAAGSIGTAAFNNISSATLKTNLQLRESHKILDEMAITIKNTVKWTLTSSAVNRMTDSIAAAWQFTKGLDTDLNDIRIVTGKSADEMERFARQANKAAQSLGAATRDYTQASLIFYQQGLSDEEVNARTNVTLKAANVTGQQASEVSEQLTAVWNGYRVSAAETEAYVDKLAAVGANTASNLEELSTAMSKVASAANTAGVPIDNLNAILSTVISVTREAPETIGTAFKTIFARLGDLSLGGTDEEGIGLGNVSTKLKALGVEVLDQQGQMREMGDIIEDVAAKWQTWTRAQQQAAAVAMAGKMQYSRLISLFENWDMYTAALNTSQDALGTLSEQQDIYMESTAAHLQQLQTAWDRVANSMIDNESMNGLVDVLTQLTTVFANFTEAIGGGGTALLLFGSIMTNVFQRQMAQGINSMINNRNAAKNNTEMLNRQIATLRMEDQATGGNDIGTRTRLEERLKMNRYIGSMNNEQIQKEFEAIDKLANAKSARQQYHQNEQDIAKVIQRIVLQNSGEQWSTEGALKALDTNQHHASNYTKYQRIWSDARDELDAYMEDVKQITMAQDRYTRAVTQSEEALKRQASVEQQITTTRNQKDAINDELRRINNNSRRNQNIINNTSSTPEQIAAAQQREVNNAIRINELTQQRENIDKQLLVLEDQKANAIVNTTQQEERANDTLQRYLHKIQQLKELLMEMSSRKDLTATQTRNVEQALMQLNRLDINNTAILSSQGAQRIVRNALDAIRQGVDDVNQQNERVNRQIQARNSHTLQQLESDIIEGQEALKQFHSEGERLVSIEQNFLNVASAVMQISSSIMMIQNLGHIWSDEDLSIGEKLLQTTMSLSMIAMQTGPLIFELLKGINEQRAADVALQSLGIAATEKNNAALIEEVILQNALIRAKQKGEMLEVQTIAGLTQEQRLRLMNTYALTGETAALNRATGAQIGFNTAVLANPYLWIALLVVGAIAGIAIAIKENEKEQQKFNKALQDSRQYVDQLKSKYDETNTAVTELKKNLEDYTQAKNALSELTVGTDAWKQQMIELNNVVLALLDKYPELAKYITQDNVTGVLTIDQKGRDAILEKQEKALTDASIAYQTAQIDIANKSMMKLADDFRKNNHFIEQAYGDPNKEKNQTVQYEDLRAQTNAKLIDIAKLVGNNTDDFLEGKLDQEILQQFKDLGIRDEYLENFSNSIDKNRQELLTLNKNLLSFTNTISTYTKTIVSTAGQNNDAYQNSRNKNIINNQLGEDYENNLRKFTNEAEEMSAYDITQWLVNNNLMPEGATDINAIHYEVWGRGNDKAVRYYDKDNKEQYITKTNLEKMYASNQARMSLDNQISRQSVQTDNAIAFMNYAQNEKYSSTLGDFISKLIGGEEVTKEFTKEQIEQYQKMWEEYLQSAEEYEIQATEEYIGKINEISTSVQNAVNAGKTREEIIAINRDRFNNNNRNLYTNANNLYSDLQSGKVTAENIASNDDYKTLKSQMEDLKNAYPELAAAANMLNETWNVGSQDYLEALNKIQEQLSKIHIEGLVNDIQQANDTLQGLLSQNDFDIELGINDTEFKNAIDEILNQNYQIDVAIHTEAEQEYENAIAAMKDIETMASKIGESFIVAADDVRALNNTFPRIIEGMVSLKDGTVQLNQEIVQSSIDSAREEVSNEVEATATKLKLQAEVLRAKQAQYEAIAAAAAILAKGEVATEEEKSNAQAEISGALSELEQLNKQAVEIQAGNSDVAIANSAKENAGIVAGNWKEAYKLATKDSYEFAMSAAQNMRAAANGGKGATLGNFDRTNYKGSEGKTGEQSALEEVQKMLDSSDTGSAADKAWGKISAQYYQMAAAVGRSATDIEGMIAGLGAKTINLDNTFGNIASGKGANPKSGSSKDPDQMDYLEDEKDFYHDINLELKKYETELARLEGQQEKLFGQDLIENYNKQLETLNKTIDATNRKIEIARGEMKLVGDYLSQRGVMFDADGYISNYTQIYEDKLRATNGIIDAYNKMSAEEQENYKDTVEAAKKDFDEFVENINRYDEIVSDLIPGLIDDIQEAQDKQIEISISKFNMAIELELDTAKLEKDWAKFQRRILKNITDKQFGYVVNKAKDILETEFKIFYDENNSGIVQNLTQQVLDTQRELEQIRAEGWSEIYGDNEAQALEDLKNYHSQLMEQMEDYQDKIDEVRGSFKELMDEAAGRIEEQLDLYEQLRGLINHDINIIKMVYGEDSYSALTPYYEQIEEQYTKELKFRRDQKEFYEAEMKSAEEHFTRESEEWRTARKNYIDALDAWKEASEQAVQATIDTYVNKIDDIFQTLEMKVTNNLGLDYVSEEWELINKSSDMYLDNLNAMYEVQKLAAKYQDAFDRTDSLSAQRAIRELQESELKDLRERDKLTKYDIERANLKYELMLKQIALEEAQQNKSSLRLRRDSQGNYTYQYVADDDAVKKAEQELGDVYNELYNLDKNRYKDNLDQAYSIYEEFHQKMRDLAANTTMDTEEKERWKALYVEQYGQMINDLLGENELIRENLRESALAHHMYIMDQDKETFEQMTDAETRDLINKFIDTANPNSILNTHGEAFRVIENIQKETANNFKAMDDAMVNDVMTNLEPNWNKGIQKMIDTFTQEGQSHNTNAFDAMVKNALKASKTEFDIFGEKVHQISKDSTTDFDTLKNDGLDPVIESSKDLVSKTDNVITQYRELHETLAGDGGVLDNLGNLETKYKSATDAAKAAADAAHAYTVELQNQMAQEAEAEKQRAAIAKAQITQNTKNVSRDSTPSSTTNPSSSKDTSGGSGDKNGGSPNGIISSPTATSPISNTTTTIRLSGAKGEQVKFKQDWFNQALTADGRGAMKKFGNPNGVWYVSDIKWNEQFPVALSSRKGGNTTLSWIKWGALQGFTGAALKTGGYTGDWADDSGKLAVLHKKELVLNATDTENILAAVDAIRSITLGQLSPRQSMMADIAAAAQSMEQNVHIDATFPNVHDASEIEAALNNLTNRASQYANRKENY